MKKALLLGVVATLLSACAVDGSSSASSMGSNMSVSNIGGTLLKTAIDNQCRTELNNRNEWRMIALAMTADKQREWENKICGCASEEAPNQITAADMTQLLSESGRTKVAAEVTAKTVTACVKRLYN